MSPGARPQKSDRESPVMNNFRHVYKVQTEKSQKCELIT